MTRRIETETVVLSSLLTSTQTLIGDMSDNREWKFPILYMCQIFKSRKTQGKTIVNRLDLVESPFAEHPCAIIRKTDHAEGNKELPPLEKIYICIIFASFFSV